LHNRELTSPEPFWKLAPLGWTGMGAVMSVRVRAFLRALVITTFGIIAAALAPVDRVYAQADPNIQSRIDAVAAPFQVQPIRPEAGGPNHATACEGYDCLSDAEIDSRFEALFKNPGRIKRLNSNRELMAELNVGVLTHQRKRQLLQAFFPPNVKPGPGNTPPKQPTTVKFTFPMSPMYETNVLKSNTSVAADTSLSFGGGVQVTAEGFRNLDVVAFAAGTNSVRYSSLTAKSLDTVTTSAAYQALLGTYKSDVKDKSGIEQFDATKGTDIPTNQITFNTLTFGVQNSTAYAPTFAAETVNLFTPTIVYAWQNIPLSQDPPCKNLSPPKTLGYCYYMDIAVTVGHTLSDQAALQNTNFALSTTFGDRIDQTDLVLALVSTVTGKVYENVPGGRNDVLFQIGPKLQYTPNKSVNASLAITYNQNYSTLAIAAWHGWVIQPTLTVAFSPN
jgi:hypothetical protein